MRHLLAMPPLLLVAFLFFFIALPARAQIPAPWPDTASTNPRTGWNAYTFLAAPVLDRPGSSDGSTGGTTPTQSADIVSTNGVPSTYFAFDPIRRVIFVRLHLASSPLTQSPDGLSNDDPWDNVTWSLLIDSDGDGFKEFAVQLQGDSGGPSNVTDDIVIYYDNARNNSIPTGATPIYRTNSALFPERDARTTYYDYGFSRTIAPAVTGGGWFLDWQVPLSGFNGLITETSPVSFAYGTSNSNTDPLQKDASFNGDYIASPTAPFPFGDVLTLSGGITQSPYIREVTAAGCGPATLTARVTDTLTVAGGTAASTIANVRWFYSPDSNGDGIPDTGSTPTLIGQANTPTPADITVFQLSWNNSSLPNGTYVISAVATDQQGNVSNSLTSSPPVVAIYSATCGVSLTGRVYSDPNHNATLDAGESGTGVTGLFIKVIPNTGGNALQAVLVDASTGSYSISAAPGTYTLILDNNNILTDTTPFLPSGFIGTEAPTQRQTGVVIGSGTLTAGQNFGLYAGSRVSGTVFNDNGAGGGIARDGTGNGAEAGLAGVTVQATNATGSVIYDTATTDASGSYTLYIPASAGATPVRIVETNLSGTISTGGQAATTGGAYDLTTDAITFNNVVGSSYSGVGFADVPPNTFVPDHQKTGLSGSVVLYPHSFTAGSAGTVSFATTNVSNPSNANWSSVVYRDTNGNGVIDTTGSPPDAVITAPITVVRGEQVFILVAVNVPADAPAGAQNTTTVTSSFSYVGAAPGPAFSISRTNVTTSAASGLELTKTVDKPTAKSGEVLTYTVTYKNISAETLNTLIINDAIPAFTTFLTASTGAFPTSLTGVTLTQPAVGRSGTLRWTFTGGLAPGSQGTVSFQVAVR